MPTIKSEIQKLQLCSNSNRLLLQDLVFASSYNKAFHFSFVKQIPKTEIWDPINAKPRNDPIKITDLD